MKVEESLNVTFDETPPPPKTSPLEDDDLVEEEAIEQTVLAISTTEAEYVSAGKACQQALWIKQALVDYGIRLDDIPIMCDNKGAIDLTSSASALQVLRRLGSIFTSIYAAVQQLKKAFGLKGGKKLLYVKRNKAISLENVTSKVAGQKKTDKQWTADERKTTNLDQRLKSLIMSVLPDDQMNSYKALVNELVNDGIKLSNLEINTGFINGLPKKWISFCQSLRNTNHVKDSELASLFGKLKYEENLIDSIYETEKNKSLVSTTPLSTAFYSTSIVQDFQDSPDDEEDTRSSQEYLNDLQEGYQARALLAKSKRFFKKGTQRYSSAKATDQTECHKCGKKGHFARDYWSKTSVPSYQ
ncbi:retrovirus-related pol polyprotein from transposon TNT 1-94 [Tanacetum coccineum]